LLLVFYLFLLCVVVAAYRQHANTQCTQEERRLDQESLEQMYSEEVDNSSSSDRLVVCVWCVVCGV